MTEPALIELARVAAGLTQGGLAKALGKTQPFISQVERGEKEIPRDLLAQWAEACEVPVSYFARDEGLPVDSVASMVHRRLKTLPAKPFHRANAIIKLTLLQVDGLLSEVDIHPSRELPELPPGIGPADAAQAVRQLWRIPEGPLPDLIKLIESCGIPVMLLTEMHEKHSAASIRGHWVEWLIALNAHHPASRRRFTLAHELGHIVLGHQRRVAADDAEAERLEQEADAFAAALLLPPAAARRELRRPDFRRLVALKQRWLVSIAFLIRQAFDNEMITARERQWLEIQLSRQPGGRRREPAEFPAEEPRLVKDIVQLLIGEDGLSLSDIADLITVQEDQLRQRFLGEVPRLRLAAPKPARPALRLDF